MTACSYPGCLAELPSRKGRGRPGEYCPEHARARKREKDKARRINSRKPETIYEGILFPCCIDWQKSGRANRTICPQHKQWRAFRKQSRAASLTSTRLNGEPAGKDGNTIASLLADGVAFSVRADPDSWKPVDHDDKAQEKALADWINERQKDHANVKVNTARKAHAAARRSRRES